MENGFDNGGHCIESARATCCIVGRDWGLTCKHSNANFVAITTSYATRFTGGDGHWSITSFSSKWSTVDVDEDEEEADDNKHEMSSPGSLPIISSNVTTPKL